MWVTQFTPHLILSPTAERHRYFGNSLRILLSFTHVAVEVNLRPDTSDILRGLVYSKVEFPQAGFL